MLSCTFSDWTARHSSHVLQTAVVSHSSVSQWPGNASSNVWSSNLLLVRLFRIWKSKLTVTTRTPTSELWCSCHPCRDRSTIRRCISVCLLSRVRADSYTWYSSVRGICKCHKEFLSFSCTDSHCIKSKTC